MTRLLLYISIVVFCFSCKSKKLVVENLEQKSDGWTEKQVIHYLNNYNQDYNWYSVVSSANIESPEGNIDAKLYLRMRKDSILWGIGKKYGAEGVRVLVTPTSYAAINRNDATYTRGDTEEALQSFGLTLGFNEMQEFLFGNIIKPNQDYQYDKDSSDHIVAFQEDNVHITYRVADGFLKNIVMKDAYQTAQVELDDYKKVEKWIVPYSRKYTITDSYGAIRRIHLEYKSVEVDVPKSTKFSIPPRYVRAQ